MVFAIILLQYTLRDNLVIYRCMTNKQENDGKISILMRKKTDLVDFIDNQTPNANVQDNFGDWNP
jgi:hypothetical protein